MKVALLAGLLAFLPSGVPAVTDTDHPTARPIVLQAERQAGRVRLLVIGDAATPVKARYTLAFGAGAGGGGNRSTQGGEVSLVPGRRVTLVDLTVSVAPTATWVATLDVTPADAVAYRIEKTASND